MPHLFFLLLCILKLALVSECAGWSSATSTIIRADDQIAVGAYNDSIYLVGGSRYDRQITEYQIDTKTFIDIGSTVLSNDASGAGQFWTQKYEIMYIIPRTGTIISTFNMITRQYTANWANIPQTVLSYGCLAILNDYLFVVGGYSGGYRNTLQVLNLLTNQWLSNPPSMNAARGNGACIAYYGYVWAFGGAQYLSTNERIKITNITSNQWSYIDPLTDIASGLRAVSWQGYIFAIAGYKGSGRYFDTVHIIDAISGNVTLSPQRLVYVVVWPAVILTNNIIYVFGGWDNIIGYKDTWMQYDLLNQDITSTPQTSSASVTDITTTSIDQMQPSSSMIDHGTTMDLTQYSNSMTVNEYNNETATVSNSTQPSVYHYYGTVLNITLDIDESVPMNDVIQTVNDTVITYLNAQGIIYSLDTDVIPREGTSEVLFIFEISHILDKDEINSKEFEDKVREDLIDEYDGKVKVEVVIDNVNQDNDKKKKKFSVNVWFIVWIITLCAMCGILVVCVCIVAWFIKSKKTKETYNQSSKIMAIDQNASSDDNANDVMQKVDLAEDQSQQKGKRDSIESLYEVAKTDGVHEMQEIEEGDGSSSKASMYDMEGEDSVKPTEGNASGDTRGTTKGTTD